MTRFAWSGVAAAARELARIARRFPGAAARFDPKRRPDRRSVPVDFGGLSRLLTDTVRAAHDGRMADAMAALAAYRAKAKNALGSYP